jgi:hypothetical protein
MSQPPEVASHVTLPAVFSVAANVGFWWGGARLEIFPAAIVLEFGQVLRSTTSVPRVVQTRPTVTLIRARLAPPWFNTSLIVKGENESGIASMWVLSRRRLRRALQAAGFTIEEVSTWFSLGKRLLRG